MNDELGKWSYWNAGKYQYIPPDTKYVQNTIWYLMKLNFVYFMKAAYYETAFCRSMGLNWNVVEADVDRLGEIALAIKSILNAKEEPKVAKRKSRRKNKKKDVPFEQHLTKTPTHVSPGKQKIKCLYCNQRYAERECCEEYNVCLSCVEEYNHRLGSMRCWICSKIVQ